EGAHPVLPGGVARDPRPGSGRGSHLQSHAPALPQQQAARGRPLPRRSAVMGHARPRVVAWIAGVAGLLLHACTSEPSMAGGSSEVDNPQVIVAFVDGDGAPRVVSGSLGFFPADESPALNPLPVVEIRLEGISSMHLSGKVLEASTGDTSRAY